MVLLMLALFRLETEEKEPSDSNENWKGIALIKDASITKAIKGMILVPNVYLLNILFIR
jgi:hypothetical protein